MIFLCLEALCNKPSFAPGNKYLVTAWSQQNLIRFMKKVDRRLVVWIRWDLLDHRIRCQLMKMFLAVDLINQLMYFVDLIYCRLLLDIFSFLFSKSIHSYCDTTVAGSFYNKCIPNSCNKLDPSLMLTFSLYHILFKKRIWIFYIERWMKIRYSKQDIVQH